MGKNDAITALTVADLMAAEDPAATVGSLRFEQGQALLQELVSRVESGDIPLDQAVLSYEIGSILLNHLRQLLNQAEERVRILRLDGSEA